MGGRLTIQDAVATVRKGDSQHTRCKISLEFVWIECVEPGLDRLHARLGVLEEFLIGGMGHG